MDDYAAFRPDISSILCEIERCVARAKSASGHMVRVIKDRINDMLIAAWVVDAHAGARLVRKIEFYNQRKLREVMQEQGVWRDSGRRKASPRKERFAREALRNGTIGDDVAFLWFDVKIDGVDKHRAMR
jgi:hypothetical protein